MSDESISDNESEFVQNKCPNVVDVLDSEHFNGFSSTPIRTKIQNSYQNHSQNENNVLEDDVNVCCDNVSFTDDDSQNDCDSHKFHLHSFEDNDDSQLSDIVELKKKCLLINSNYEILQNKFQRLHTKNDDNLQIIDSLQSKIKLLEIQLKEEQQLKDSVSRKAEIFESRVDSLEYQLKEIYDSDFLAKNNENNAKAISSLKQKHQNEVSRLRIDFENELCQVKQRLAKQEQTIFSQNEMIAKYKQEVNKLEQMAHLSKELNESELKKRIEIELQQSKEKIELNLLSSFDQSMNKLKFDWDTKLQEDIDQIIIQIENRFKVDSNGNLSSDVDLRFKKLYELYESIENSFTAREEQIQNQIVNLKEAKCQLDEVLLESKMSSSNVSCSSDKTEELKNELILVKNESKKLTQKLNKYKQHYHSLDKRHKQEMELIKHKFITIIEDLKSKQNYKL